MSDITLEKTHALLEKLGEFVMNKIPQMDTRLQQIEIGLGLKADKTDVSDLKRDVNRLEEKVDTLLGSKK